MTSRPRKYSDDDRRMDVDEEEENEEESSEDDSEQVRKSYHNFGSNGVFCGFYADEETANRIRVTAMLFELLNEMKVYSYEDALRYLMEDNSDEDEESEDNDNDEDNNDENNGYEDEEENVDEETAHDPEDPPPNPPVVPAVEPNVHDYNVNDYIGNIHKLSHILCTNDRSKLRSLMEQGDFDFQPALQSHSCVQAWTQYAIKHQRQGDPIPLTIHPLVAMLEDAGYLPHHTCCIDDNGVGIYAKHDEPYTFLWPMIQAYCTRYGSLLGFHWVRQEIREQVSLLLSNSSLFECMLKEMIELDLFTLDDREELLITLLDRESSGSMAKRVVQSGYVDKEVQRSFVTPELLLRVIREVSPRNINVAIEIVDMLLFTLFDTLCTIPSNVGSREVGKTLYQHAINYCLVQSYSSLGLIKHFIEKYHANPNVLIPIDCIEDTYTAIHVDALQGEYEMFLTDCDSRSPYHIGHQWSIGEDSYYDEGVNDLIEGWTVLHRVLHHKDCSNFERYEMRVAYLVHYGNANPYTRNIGSITDVSAIEWIPKKLLYSPEFMKWVQQYKNIYI